MRYGFGLTSLVAAVATVAGCAVGTGTSQDIGSTSSAVVGQDEFVYFRCNSTSWGTNDVSRLRSTADPYVFTLYYNVTQSYMTQPGGDNCQFTKTNEYNGWGTSQTNYGAVHGTVSVPGGDYLNENLPGFNVVYPALGQYKVVANWMQGTFAVSPATPADWDPCAGSRLTTFAPWVGAPGNILAGCANGDIYLTFDGTSAHPSWLRTDIWQTSIGVIDIMPSLPVNAIATNPVDLQSGYAAFAGTKQGHKLWRFTAGPSGAAFTETAQPPVEVWGLSVNPLDASIVYVFGPGGAAMSPDFGATWTTSVSAGPLTVPLASGSTISAVTVVNNDRNIVWVGATNGDIFFTNDALSGQHWTQANRSPMPARAVTRLTGDPAFLNPPAVYATFDGMSNDSVWMTRNGGQAWINIHNPALPTTTMPLPGVYGMYGVSVNPAFPTALTVDGAYGAGSSADRGATWTWTN